MVEMINHCTTLRVVALHYCYTSSKSAIDLVLPTKKQVMGSDLRLRLRLHIGGDKEIMMGLMEYGILHLDKALGGTLELDGDWVEDRIRQELLERKGTAKIVKPTAASTPKRGRKPTLFSRAA